MLRGASPRLAWWLAPLALALAVFWPESAGAASPTHVACVGDSITYGYLASSPSASYPSDLQKMFGGAVSVMNFGHSSATMLSVGDLPYQNQSEYTAATSFVSGAGANAVVAVVIMLGTNDTKSYNWMSGGTTRATQFQTDTAAMVDHFAKLATHPTVYLALPPRVYTNTYGIDGSILQNQIDPILRSVAASKGIATIDIDTPTAGHPELFSDGVHPTDAGYTLLAMIVHDALVAGGNGTGGTAGGGEGGTSSGGAGGASGGGGHGGGSSGSGGTATGGTGGGSGTGGAHTGGTSSGGVGTGGVGTGGTGTGGVSTGGVSSGGTSTGGTSTGGIGTGGVRGGTGGQGAVASGGVSPSSSGGAATSSSTGGTKAGGETNGGGGGCAVSGAGEGAGPSLASVLLLGLLATWVRRRRGWRDDPL